MRDITGAKEYDISIPAIMRRGELFEDGTKQEWYQELLGYGDKRVSDLAKELIFGDQETLKEVYFLKGQIASILDIQNHPYKIIKMRKDEITKREKLMEDKKEKEKKRG